MQRISALNLDETPAASRALLEGVQRKIGIAPNLFRTMAHSSAALRAYLSQSEALSAGVLSAGIREQIALAIAGANQCDYCASAHTLMGRAAGVEDAELALNLGGRSEDPKTQAALDFARAIVQTRGRITDDRVAAVRAAGFSEAELVEIVAHVGMNIFTNYFNHIAGTEIDFPLVNTTEAAAA